MGKKEEINQIKRYIQKLEVELVMGNYNNGWFNDWCKEKIVELTQRLKTIEND